jgi:hypothetical protein
VYATRPARLLAVAAATSLQRRVRVMSAPSATL